MAAPDIVKGTYLDILLGDGASPEVFNILCGLTTRSFTEQTNTNDNFVPDCADPESVPFRELIATGKQWDMQGEGLLNLAQLDNVRAASGVLKNYRFVIGRPTGSTVGTGNFAGAAMITNLQIGGSSADGQLASVNLTIASSGAWTWNAA